MRKRWASRAYRTVKDESDESGPLVVDSPSFEESFVGSSQHGESIESVVGDDMAPNFGQAHPGSSSNSPQPSPLTHSKTTESFDEAIVREFR